MASGSGIVLEQVVEDLWEGTPRPWDRRREFLPQCSWALAIDRISPSCADEVVGPGRCRVPVFRNCPWVSKPDAVTWRRVRLVGDLGVVHLEKAVLEGDGWN